MVRHAAHSCCARIFLAAALLVPALSAAMPGELDPSFGTNGVVRMDLGFAASARIEASVRQPMANKVVVAGTVTLAGGEHGVLLGRFNGDASLDTTFGNGGWVVLQGGLVDPTEVRGLALRSDEGVVVLVKSGTRTGVGMRQADGSRYPTYGAPPPPDLQLDPFAESLGFDPRALVVGTYSNLIYLAGSVPADAGTQRGRDSFGLLYPADGAPYAYAATRYSIGSGDDEILAMYQASNGDLVIAGRTRESGSNDDAFVARVFDYFSPSVLSQVVIDHQGNDDSATTLFWDNGRLLVGGRTQDASGVGRFLVASVMAMSSQLMLDTTFGSSGKTVLEFPALSGQAYDATLRMIAYTNALVIAGSARNIATGESRFVATWLDSYSGNQIPYGPMAGWAMGGYFDPAARDEVLVGAHPDYQWSNDLNVFGRYTADGLQQVGIRRLRFGMFDDYYPAWGGTGLRLKSWQRSTTDSVLGLARAFERIFVLGTSDDDTVLARLRQDGALDQVLYQPAPLVRLTPGQFPYEPVGLVLDSMGRLVVGSDGGAGTFVASRFDPSLLQLDPSFGAAGNATVPAGVATARAVAVAADDSVAVVGSYVGADSKTHPAIARIGSNGSPLGPTLLLDGVEMAPRAAAFTADGKLVIAGGVPDGPGVAARVAQDGSVDFVWSTPGGPYIPSATFNSIAIAADGTVYVSGSCLEGGWKRDYCAAGLTPAGVLGDFGFQVASLSGTDDDAVASGLSTEGKLVIAGDSYHTSEFKAIAFHADGSRDNQFAAPYGIAVSGQYGVAAKGAVAADGRFLLAGETVDGDWLLVQWREALDTVPAPFTFGSQEPVAMGQWITSPPVMIDGTAGPAPVRLSDAGSARYSIGCTGTFVTSPGTISSGQSVCLQVLAASQPGTSTTGTLFVGGVKGTFTVRTGAVVADVTITQAPASLTNQATGIFAFTSSDASAQFQCRIDGAALAPCASPFQTAPLAEGFHSFTVVAINATGMSPPAEHQWTIDTIAPSITIDSQPPFLGTSPNATLAFHATDAHTVSLECSLDDAPFAACTSPTSYTGLASTPHTFAVRGTDAAGNVATWTTRWVVDFDAPGTTIVSGPASPTNAATSTFVFSSDDPSATFECDGSGAGNAFYPCTNPTSFSNAPFADGTYVVYVRAKDAAGNVDPTPASWTFTLDRTPPETSLNYAPTGVTNQTTASASFFSEGGATFECRLDGAAYAACTSPVTYSALADGAHSIDIRAKDAAGNVDPTPSSSSWTIDRTAPDTALTNGPSGTVAQASGTFEFSSADTGATFQCAVDSGAWFGCASPYPFYNLADGTHLFEVRAIDAASNFDPSPASRTWTVDTTAPSTTITSGPDAITPFTAASFVFSSPDGVSFKCSLDGAVAATCTSPANYSGLAGGGHSFAVFAIDAAGNADASPATWSWAVDVTAPETTITAGPTGTTAQTTASISFTSDDPAATFECRLDGAAFAACTSPVSLSGLANGAHTFEVRSKDVAGNADASPASRAWSVDTLAPDTTIASGPTGTVTQTSATFTFTSNDAGATFECRLDGAAFAACTSPKTYSGLSSAAHVFEVRAKDAAGNVDATPASRSWTVDTVAPDTSITGGPATAVNVTTASFTFTATESATFECKLDSGAFAACTSPKSYSGLAVGSHTFQVRARDAVGNLDASPATRTWTIDTTAPNTTITSGPSGSNNPNTATFAFTSTEGGTFECKLDTGAFAACTTPKTYTSLARGSHTFQVRAIDAAGNVDASPASRTWSVK